MKRFCGLLSFILLSCSLHAEIINHFTCDGALSETGKPVPGWNISMAGADHAFALKHPEHVFAVVGALDENGKKCVKIDPAGSYLIDIRTEPMHISENGYVVISFEAKSGPLPEKADLQLTMDFRTAEDQSVKPEKWWKHPRFPVITGIRRVLTPQWKTYKTKVKVIPWKKSYQLTFGLRSPSHRKLMTPVFLRNVKVEFLDQKNSKKETAAVIPDRQENYYFNGEEISLKIRSKLNETAPQVSAELQLDPVIYPKIKKTCQVQLKKDGDIYTGEVKLKADRYDSFRTSLSVNGRKVKTIGGFVILHKPVNHPRFSPGWTLGCNVACTYRTGFSDQIAGEAFHVRFSSPENLGKLLHLIGMRNVRVWAYWKGLEPFENQYSGNALNTGIELLRANGIEPVLCIAAANGLTFPDQGDKTDRAGYPQHLYKHLRPFDYLEKHNKKRVILDAPVEKFGNLVDFCLNRWNGKVRIWEIFNEPGDHKMKPEQYLKYLYCAYEKVKKADRNNIVLGNGNTCDIGFDKGWSARLNAADPDYVDHLDGIAFHPYFNDTDYYKGIYGLYSKHIKELRSLLKKPRPLYNTECYYIRNAEREQFGDRELSLPAAESVQRHYLDGLLNDVKMASSLGEATLVESDPSSTAFRIMEEHTVAVNALSAMLKDMDKLTPVALGEFMRGGIFVSKSEKEAVGFVYDMRPSGSGIVFPKELDVKLYDMLGNPFTGEMIASYSPVYIKGTPSEVKKFFSIVKFTPRISCPIYARKFDDRLFLNAVNTIGQASQLRVTFSPKEKNPDVWFHFRDAKADAVIDIPIGTIIDGTVYESEVNRSKLRPGKLRILPDSGSGVISSKREKAETIKLKQGSTLQMWHDKDFLHIHAEVPVKKITAAPGEKLWKGDAVEVFIDRDPFSRLTRSETRGAPIDCLQYIFAAEPSKTGLKRVLISRMDPSETTQSDCISRRTGNGYALDIRIPLSEIRGKYNGIIGLNVEISRPGEKQKERLGKGKRPAYNFRLEYPLFRFEGVSPAIVNGDFKQITSKGQPSGWRCSKLTENSRISVKTNGGISGENTVGITSDVPENPAHGLWQRIKIPAYANTLCLTLTAKFDSYTIKPGKKDNLWRPLGFYLGGAIQDMGNLLKRNFAQPFPWTRIQCYIPLKKDKEKGETWIETGFRWGTGTVTISDIRADFLP